LIQLASSVTLLDNSALSGRLVVICFLYALYDVSSVRIVLEIFLASSFLTDSGILSIVLYVAAHNPAVPAAAQITAAFSVSLSPLIVLSVVLVAVVFVDVVSVSACFLLFLPNISSILLALSFALISEALASATLPSVPAPTVVRHHELVGIGINGSDANIFPAVSLNFQSPTGVPLKTLSITVMRSNQTIATPKRFINIQPKISLWGPVTLIPKALCCSSAIPAI